MIDYTTYGSLDDANTYFQNKLHNYAWVNASPTQQQAALLAATRTIDSLAFKGYKASTWALLSTYNPIPTLDMVTTNIQPAVQIGPDIAIQLPTPAQVYAAEAAQVHEFPRGTDTAVPDDIVRACYEIAYSLLDGKDPEIELENLGVESHGYSSVRTSYSRTHVPVEHIVNLVPSAIAWRILRPFLRDDQAVKLSRVS